MRRLWMGLVALAAIAVVSKPAEALPDLTAGLWDIENSIDLSGLTWNESTLVFTSQTPDGDDADLAGYFDWVGSGGQFGRENFVGTAFADHTLQLFGQGIDPAFPSSGIVTGTYSGIISSDGSRILDGTWSATGVIPGEWEARRVPEASRGSLLALGLGLVVAALRTRGPPATEAAPSRRRRRQVPSAARLLVSLARRPASTSISTSSACTRSGPCWRATRSSSPRSRPGRALASSPARPSTTSSSPSAQAPASSPSLRPASPDTLGPLASTPPGMPARCSSRFAAFALACPMWLAFAGPAEAVLVTYGFTAEVGDFRDVGLGDAGLVAQGTAVAGWFTLDTGAPVQGPIPPRLDTGTTRSAYGFDLPMSLTLSGFSDVPPENWTT